MTLKVGDYVRAILVTHVPISECDVDLTREGIVIELRNGNSECILSSYTDTEFMCMTEGAILVQPETLDPAIQEFVAETREALRVKK